MFTVDGLWIGLDLCDDYSQLSVFGKDTMDAESFFWDILCLGESGIDFS